MKECRFCLSVMPENLEWVEGEWISEDGLDWHTTYGVGCMVCECHGPMMKTQEQAVVAWDNGIQNDGE